MKTAWGADITASWEQEGQSALILQWFKPPEPLARKHGWAQIEPIVKRDPTDPQVSKWLGAFKRAEWFNAGGTCRWSDFVATEAKPAWVDPKIEQEVDAGVWEIKSADKRWTFTLWELYERVRLLSEKLRHAPLGMQVHIVFDRPPNKGQFNARLAALVDFLNLSIAGQEYGGSGAIFLPFIGASRMAPGVVKNKLDSHTDLEKADSHGHRVGPLKFNYVGLREAYGKGKLGLEFRSGYTRNSVAQYMKQIDHAVYILGHLGSIHGRSSGGLPTTDMDLMSHYDFANKFVPDKLVPKHLRVFLTRAAEECIKQLLARNQKVPWGAQNNPQILVRRWALAFIPWENHPLVIGTRVSQVDKLRTALIADLDKLMAAARREKKDVPNTNVNPTDVNTRFAKFFSDANISELLLEG
jgi:hypothetical protein